MRTPRFLVIAFAAAATFWTTGAHANLEDMVSCRNISDDAGRLACYDRAVDGVREELQAQSEDLAQERDQRSFFGLPSFSVPNVLRRRETTEEEFGSAELDRERAREEGRTEELREEAGIIDSITANVVEWGRNPRGLTFVVLDNGHVWRLTEPRNLSLRRNRENTVTIRRGRMGSFFIKANDVNAEYRVERIR
jgi:hypothetical protein